jgi:hypothetical protein
MNDYVGDCPGVLRFSPAPPNGFPQCDYTPQQPLLPPGPHHPINPRTPCRSPTHSFWWASRSPLRSR